MTLRNGIFAVAAAAFLIAGTGCSNSKLTAERDTLATQNKDLMAQLQTEREARQIAETHASQVAALPSDPATPDMGPLVFNPGRTPAPTHPGVTPPSRTPSTPVIRATPTTRLTLPGNVLFASGKVTLDATATKTLDTIAATIKSKYKGDKLEVNGFTDATPPSKTSVWTSNEDLAKARATAVKNYLVKKGIASADITVKAMGPTGTGASATSRKVEVAVIK